MKKFTIFIICLIVLSIILLTIVYTIFIIKINHNKIYNNILYDDFEKKIKNGDIIMFSQRKDFSLNYTITAIYDDTIFFHIGIIIIDKNNNKYILHADNRHKQFGIYIDEFKNYVSKYIIYFDTIISHYSIKNDFIINPIDLINESIKYTKMNFLYKELDLYYNYIHRYLLRQKYIKRDIINCNIYIGFIMEYLGIFKNIADDYILIYTPTNMQKLLIESDAYINVDKYDVKLSDSLINEDDGNVSLF
jgi:hypothetical protein